MDLIEQAKKALENGYTTDIGKLYSAFSDAIITAGDNQDKINEAKERFKKGFETTKKIYNEAMAMIS